MQCIASDSITVPLSLIHQLITSPLTLSLVLRLILLFLLLAASGVMSVIAVGTFWWTWGRAGDVEVEGWLVYGCVRRLQTGVKRKS